MFCFNILKLYYCRISWININKTIFMQIYHLILPSSECIDMCRRCWMCIFRCINIMTLKLHTTSLIITVHCPWIPSALNLIFSGYNQVKSAYQALSQFLLKMIGSFFLFWEMPHVPGFNGAPHINLIKCQWPSVVLSNCNWRTYVHHINMSW